MSLSPEPVTRSEDENSKKISFRFCSECSNLLYPKEDKVNSRLLYACRTCEHSMDAPTLCVTRHEVASTVGDTAGITQDVGSDPTLPRIDKQCPVCSENEAVFFQSQQRSAETGMKLYYVCCTCGHVWQDPSKKNDGTEDVKDE